VRALVKKLKHSSIGDLPVRRNSMFYDDAHRVLERTALGKTPFVIRRHSVQAVTNEPRLRNETA
jgi:hypothetical protein